MPLLTAQTIVSAETVDLTLVTLDGSTDTFTANTAKAQALQFVNTTEAPIVITMLGDGAPATHYWAGYGVDAVDPVSVTVPANATVFRATLPVIGILKGVTTITGGVGLDAALINLS